MTPAANHLFTVQEDGEKLCQNDADNYHHTAAQMLFISGRARRNLQTVVAFLTTRVKGPDKDDWGKLKRALKYVNGTRRLKLRIKIGGSPDLTNPMWYINGSHCVHWDSRGHGGAALMMGTRAMLRYSNRLRINTRSSTETELVTVDRYMPEILWTMYFLRDQGYDIKCSKIAQDNEAAQLLETRGKFSSTLRTKHIKNKYFFVKDQVDQGGVAIIDCPTEDMWADYQSKPQQGRLFKRMRAALMGCSENYVDPLDPTPKSTHSVNRSGNEGKAKLRAIAGSHGGPRGNRGPPKTRSANTWPSSQEFVANNVFTQPSDQPIVQKDRKIPGNGANEYLRARATPRRAAAGSRGMTRHRTANFAEPTANPDVRSGAGRGRTWAKIAVA